MSRRRGAPSLDPEAEERRKWYAGIQETYRNREKREQAEGKSQSENRLSIPKQTAADEDNDDDESSVLGGPKKAGAPSSGTLLSPSPTKVSTAASITSFSSFALELFDEFSVQSTTSYAETKPPAPVYRQPKDLQALRWLKPWVESGGKKSVTREQPLSRKLPRTLLVCFPGVGESAMLYKPWALFCSKIGVTLYTVCMPGRMNRCKEVMPSTVYEIGGQVCDALLSLQLVAPPPDTTHFTYKDRCEYVAPRVIFFGHSLGGLVALETSRLLSKRGVKITHMIISSCLSPHTLTTKNLDRFRVKQCDLTDYQLVKVLKEEYQGVPDFMYQRNDLLRIFVAPIRSDIRLLETYYCYTDEELAEAAVASVSEGKSSGKKKAAAVTAQDSKKDDFPDPLVDFPITCLGTEDDRFCPADLLLEWSSVTSETHTHYIFPAGLGGHRYLSCLSGVDVTAPPSPTTRPHSTNPFSSPTAASGAHREEEEEQGVASSPAASVSSRAASRSGKGAVSRAESKSSILGPTDDLSSTTHKEFTESIDVIDRSDQRDDSPSRVRSARAPSSRSRFSAVASKTADTLRSIVTCIALGQQDVRLFLMAIEEKEGY